MLVKPFVVAGGVAANQALRVALANVAARHGFTLYAPPIGLCSDNGAMIAWAGAERLQLGLVDGLSGSRQAALATGPSCRSSCWRRRQSLHVIL